MTAGLKIVPCSHHVSGESPEDLAWRQYPKCFPHQHCSQYSLLQQKGLPREREVLFPNLEHLASGRQLDHQCLKRKEEVLSTVQLGGFAVCHQN